MKPHQGPPSDGLWQEQLRPFLATISKCSLRPSDWRLWRRSCYLSAEGHALQHCQGRIYLHNKSTRDYPFSPFSWMGILEQFGHTAAAAASLAYSIIHVYMHG